MSASGTKLIRLCWAGAIGGAEKASFRETVVQQDTSRESPFCPVTSCCPETEGNLGPSFGIDREVLLSILTCLDDSFSVCQVHHPFSAPAAQKLLRRSITGKKHPRRLWCRGSVLNGMVNHLDWESTWSSQLRSHSVAEKLFRSELPPQSVSVLNIPRNVYTFCSSWASDSCHCLCRQGLLLRGTYLHPRRLKKLSPSRHLQKSPGPPGPNSQKSLKKGLFGGLEKSLKKYPKKSKNTDFRTFLVFFSVFLETFGYFWDFLQTPQKTLFETFFAISGPEGLETPVNGGSGRNLWRFHNPSPSRYLCPPAQQWTSLSSVGPLCQQTALWLKSRRPLLMQRHGCGTACRL